MNRTQYLESLASEGLRIASSDESGWTHGYHDDARGEKVATWITDAPAIATPAKVATIAAEVGVTESQVQGIIAFETSTDNADTIKCEFCKRIQPIGNAIDVHFDYEEWRMVGFCAECQKQDEKESTKVAALRGATVALSLPGFDWDWCMDALAKQPRCDWKHNVLWNHIKSVVNIRNRKSQTIRFTPQDVSLILKALDAYLPWETRETQGDLRDLMATINRQVVREVL